MIRRLRIFSELKKLKAIPLLKKYVEGEISITEAVKIEKG